MSRRTAPGLGRDAAVILGWFAVLGVVGGVLWWVATPLAEWTRTRDSATMDEQMLGASVAADGWFLVIAAVGGLVSGFVLTAWRKRDPVATVLLVALGSALACGLMYLVGHTLGPGSYQEALRTARVGESVPVPLSVQAKGVYLVWPVGALFTSLAVLWGTRDESTDVQEAETVG